MYYFAAVEQTSLLKFAAFFLRFQTEECLLWVKKSEMTCENGFSGYLFELKDNHKSSKDEKT